MDDGEKELEVRHQGRKEGSRQTRKGERKGPGKLWTGAWAGGCLMVFWEESDGLVQGNA